MLAIVAYLAGLTVVWRALEPVWPPLVTTSYAVLGAVILVMSRRPGSNPLLRRLGGVTMLVVVARLLLVDLSAVETIGGCCSFSSAGRCSSIPGTGCSRELRGQPRSSPQTPQLCCPCRANQSLRDGSSPRGITLRAAPPSRSIMSTKKLVQFFAVVLAVAVSAASAQAQHNSAIRDGFWISGGLGYGSLGCDNCGGSREGGVSGDMSLGGTISPRWLLGVGSAAWTKTQQGATMTVGTLDARDRSTPPRLVASF